MENKEGGGGVNKRGTGQEVREQERMEWDVSNYSRRTVKNRNWTS